MLFLAPKVNRQPYLNYLCIIQTDNLFEPDISGSEPPDNAVNYSNYSSWSWLNPRTRNLSNNLAYLLFEPPNIYVPYVYLTDNKIQNLSLYLSPLTFFLVLSQTRIQSRFCSQHENTLALFSVKDHEFIEALSFGDNHELVTISWNYQMKQSNG